jgi:hypothetical protein
MEPVKEKERERKRRNRKIKLNSEERGGVEQYRKKLNI